MTTDLKTRRSGVDGIVIRDAGKGVGVNGGKYTLVHEASGLLLSHLQFRKVSDAKAAAADLEQLGPWDIEPEHLGPRATEVDRIVRRHWLEHQPAAKPSKTAAAALSDSGSELPPAVFAASQGGRCSCGLAELDPLHRGWHQVWWWNRGVFQVGRARRAKEFQDRLEVRNRRELAALRQSGATTS